MEHIDLAKYTKADGQIDYDTLLTDKMSDDLKQTIIKLEQNKSVGDGIIRNIELLTKYDNRNKKEAFVVVSMEKDRDTKEERFLKRIEQEERKIQREQELLETKEAYNLAHLNDENSISLDDFKRETIDTLIDGDPLLRNTLLHETKKPYEQYGQTHTINIRQHYNRYGKMVSNVTANTKQVDSMRQLKSKNFGSIQDFEIDTIPLSMFRGKGMEKIALYEQEKQDRKGKFLINRRFVSKLVSFWGYIMDIQYINTTPDDNHLTAIKVWGNPELFYGLDNKKMEQYFGYGDICFPLIKDILYLIRNKPIEVGKLSPQFFQVMEYKKRAYKVAKIKFDQTKYYQDIKSRLYYDYQLNGSAWAFPKISPEYLIGLLEELKSNKYVLDQKIPLIYDLWNFPIKCTDMNLRPMTNEQHDANKDDYDLSAIVFERD